MTKQEEMRILENFIGAKSKAYRNRSANYIVVRDILLRRTSTAGMTSCCAKCIELGIDPYGYDLNPYTAPPKE